MSSQYLILFAAFEGILAKQCPATTLPNLLICSPFRTTIEVLNIESLVSCNILANLTFTNVSKVTLISSNISECDLSATTVIPKDNGSLLIDVHSNELLKTFYFPRVVNYTHEPQVNFSSNPLLESEPFYSVKDEVTEPPKSNGTGSRRRSKALALYRSKRRNRKRRRRFRNRDRWSNEEKKKYKQKLSQDKVKNICAMMISLISMIISFASFIFRQSHSANRIGFRKIFRDGAMYIRYIF